MNHEEFEKEMIDGVNRNAEEKSMCCENAVTTEQSLFTKTDVTILTLGLKRMVIALFTAVLFAISVCGFIVTALARGYLAVLLFFASVLALVCSIVFLYAQGIPHKAPAERWLQK